MTVRGEYAQPMGMSAVGTLALIVCYDVVKYLVQMVLL